MSRIDEIRARLDEDCGPAQLESDVRHLLAELDRCRKVVEAADAQTKFLIRGYNDEAANRNAGDIRRWMDAHEVAIMDAVDEYEKGGG